jgi:hypothetical protein
MGTWGHDSFENDTACDWSFALEEVGDLRLIEQTIAAVLASEHVDTSTAEEGIAACEVIARLRGQFGTRDAYTESIDQWVAAHSITPSPELLTQARKAIDSILGEDSELRSSWEDAGELQEWTAAVSNLRSRLSG